MAEVRAGVDAFDDRIVALPAERSSLVAAAARLKPARDQVRGEARKAAVLARARAAASAHGTNPHVISATYELLVERSTAYKTDQWDQPGASGEKVP